MAASKALANHQPSCGGNRARGDDHRRTISSPTGNIHDRSALNRMPSSAKALPHHRALTPRESSPTRQHASVRRRQTRRRPWHCAPFRAVRICAGHRPEEIAPKNILMTGNAASARPSRQAPGQLAQSPSSRSKHRSTRGGLRPAATSSRGARWSRAPSTWSSTSGAGIAPPSRESAEELVLDLLLPPLRSPRVLRGPQPPARTRPPHARDIARAAARRTAGSQARSRSRPRTSFPRRDHCRSSSRVDIMSRH